MRSVKKMLSLLLALALVLGLLPALRLTAEAANVTINATNFPDGNFRTFVKQYDTNGDNVLSDAERAKVNKIDCKSNSIESLKGVEYFTSLTELHCDKNKLTSLDISKNTSLKELSCSSNQLTVLRVDQNPELQSIDCVNNKITTLDLTKCKKLKRVYCYTNQIAALDVRNAPDLEIFYCDRNQLSSLDVSKNTKLQSFICSQNDLTALDVSCNPNLTYLDCGYNDIPFLDVSNNPELLTLKCLYTKIPNLDLSRNTKLTYLACAYTDTLTVLDISKVPAIRQTVLEGTKEVDGVNAWYKLGNYYLSVSTDTVILTEANGLPINSTNFPDANFRTCVKTFDTNSNGFFTIAELNAVTKLDCHSRNIASLQGVGFFGKLSTLNCRDNQLTALDLNKNYSLQVVYCYSNALATLTVRECPMLRELWCHNNQLKDLTLQFNPELLVLSCGDNQISSFYLRANTKLQKLYCYRNKQMYTVDLSCNPELTYLSCFGLQLSTLDLSKNPKLEELYCQENRFSSLDLTCLPKLRICSVFSNQLTSLDVSKNINLWNLDCHDNQLTKLDVSKVPGLSYAYKRSYRADLGTYYRYQLQIATLFVDKGVTVTAEEMCPFSDVSANKYYYEPVLWAYYNDPQITGGVSEGKFGPGKNCTREQIVTFLWKAAGAPKPTSTANPFTDVKAGKYYYDAVLWAVENKITGGVGGGKFGVGQPCTREQAVTFLWVACGKPEAHWTTNPFTDVKAGKYYYDAVLWAVENGITSGVSDTTFGVGKTCTRGQIVTFLYKAFGPKG